MKLEDCEITYRSVRGHNLTFFYGPRAVTAEEGASLLAEYLNAYGPRPTPAYASPDGWQLLAPIAPAVQEAAVEAPKTAPAKTTKR